MARARSIKPGFFKNDQLAELPMSDRLLFSGLWMLADREGRLEDRPKRIKAEIFPYDDVDVDGCLSRLNDAGFITRYCVGSERFICIPTWLRHQNPHKNEPLSRIPPPVNVPVVNPECTDELDTCPEEIESDTEELGSTPADLRLLTPDSGLLTPDYRTRSTPTPTPSGLPFLEIQYHYSRHRDFHKPNKRDSVAAESLVARSGATMTEVSIVLLLDGYHDDEAERKRGYSFPNFLRWQLKHPESEGVPYGDTIPQTWNEIVTSAPYRWNGHAPLEDLRASARDPDFVAKWVEICRECQKLIESDPDFYTWLTLPWVLAEKNKRRNWERILNRDFKPKPKPTPKPARGTFDDVIAKLESASDDAGK